MDFYVISNGYFASGYVRCYVVASDDTKALKLARAKFKAIADEKDCLGRSQYSETYYNNLKIEYRIPGDAESASELDE